MRRSVSFTIRLGSAMIAAVDVSLEMCTATGIVGSDADAMYVRCCIWAWYGRCQAQRGASKKAGQYGGDPAEGLPL